MASEDSVENFTLRCAPVLAVPVDRVGKVDQLYEPIAATMPSLAHQVDSCREDLIVRYPRRKAHVTLEERDHYVPED
jgi:hypothetical protein